MTNFFIGGKSPIIFQNSKSNGVCCGCNTGGAVCYCYQVETSGSGVEVAYVDCNGESRTYTFSLSEIKRFCVQTEFTSVTNSRPEYPVVITNLGLCSTTDCTDPVTCNCWSVNTLITANVTYTDCTTGEQVETSLPAGRNFICSFTQPISDDPSATITLNGLCGIDTSPCGA
jgi:hypothetical protein